MKIEVTAEDIREGVPMDECRCPIACAIKRQTAFRSVEVMRNTIRLDSIISIRTPAEASIFMHRFDNRRQVFPFTLELDDP